MKQKRYRVRFNLGRGPRYRKWQIKDMVTGEVEHHDPDEVSLMIVKGVLRNQRATAEKIFDGANKTVCAWIETDSKPDVFSTFSDEEIVGFGFGYNPRMKPHWVQHGENIDGETIGLIQSKGRELYALNF